MMDDHTEILLQSGLLCAAESYLSMGRDVHSFTRSIQLFFWQLRRRPPSSVPWRPVLHKES
ncbi:hypothetical protein DPMN_118273 [Dreissena polymorpha]|uniref:Uncharacterized protein n=1 Tax=Dreissena polymorpha TaxID=45954 RepID=A0A9D4GMT6_DREPO|nr:hypothetical protein DPMN_118273 [Dreissena polymorpha]